ncbi:50S ribosomal protein L32 [Patescibacteria group bacterium]|nr:50S ribosomal protein L32 [Patescibacteria group bacterium]
MAKHPVPKRRQSKSNIRKRYAAFTADAVKKLENRVNLVDCTNCGEKRLSHHICPSCGMYRGRKMIIKNEGKEEQITKIKA